jgi:hypothetical protein
VASAIEKTCESCGQLFPCQKEGECWCRSVELDPGTRTQLENKFRDCLCESCLKVIAAQPERD